MKTVLGIFFSILLSGIPAAGAIDFQAGGESCGCSMERCCVQPASGTPAPVQNAPVRPASSHEGLAVAPANAPVAALFSEAQFLAPSFDQLPLILSAVPLFQRYCSLLI